MKTNGVFSACRLGRVLYNMAMMYVAPVSLFPRLRSRISSSRCGRAGLIFFQQCEDVFQASGDLIVFFGYCAAGTDADTDVDTHAKGDVRGVVVKQK